MSDSVTFFNRKSLYHTLISVSFLIITDLFIYLSNTENALSISFYVKFIVCIIYALAMKEDAYGRDENGSIECAFHILLTFSTILLALINYVTLSNPPSKFIGVFLILGLFGLFNIIAELNRHFLGLTRRASVLLIWLLMLLKILFFFVVCASAFFLIIGEWRWDIKPFYEW